MKDDTIFSLEDGKALVKMARKTVTEFLKNGKRMKIDKDFQKKYSFDSGVFVTLSNQIGLRGCIGYPLPQKKLYDALEKAAIAASTEDPRFTPVKFEELDSTTFEVTILTPAQKIKVKEPEEYLTKIKVGRDGLIVSYGYNSGLLLPQVPIEHGWNEEEFLQHTCEKAGLPKNYWKKPEIEIKKFQGIVFKEKFPNGEIIQEKLLD
jgi:uncharacterized protein (TIGR00296 family)